MCWFCFPEPGACAGGRHNCAADATCTDTPPSYVCTCKPGFLGDGSSCTDSSLCSSVNNIPIQSTSIHMFNHSTCHVSGSGQCQCICDPGFKTSQLNALECEDENECASGNVSCPKGRVCVNTHGSYDCHCRPGYFLNESSCMNVDECVAEVHDCDPNAECIDNYGSYTCSCHVGFSGNGTMCEGK